MPGGAPGAHAFGAGELQRPTLLQEAGDELELGGRVAVQQPVPLVADRAEQRGQLGRRAGS